MVMNAAAAAAAVKRRKNMKKAFREIRAGLGAGQQGP